MLSRFEQLRAGVALLVTSCSIALLLAGHAPSGAQVVDAKFELFVTNVGDSVRFYEALGFSVAHAKADGYSILRSGNTVVALSPVPWSMPLRLVGLLRHPPIGTEIVFSTDRLEQLHEELAGAGYSAGKVTLQPWGDRDFRLTDPDGYYVRLSEGRAVPRAQTPAPHASDGRPVALATPASADETDP